MASKRTASRATACPRLAGRSVSWTCRPASPVQQELEAALGRLEKGLPPETYEKVLQLMTAEDDDVNAPVAGNLEPPQ